MSKNVIILGAGASAQDGAPVISNFLSAAYDTYEKFQDNSHDRQQFDHVFECIKLLYKTNAMASIDLANIEDVFSVFEMAELCKIGGFEDNSATTAIKRLIARTLESTLRFDDRETRAPHAYHHFVKALFRHDKDDPIVITFNYDVGLDFAMVHNQIPVDYGIGGDRKANLIKLHGSINWGQCDECKKIEIRKFQSGIVEYIRDDRCIISEEMDRYHCADPGCSHSKAGPCFRVRPFIVPPTWSKKVHADTLSGLWQQAASALSNAQNIFVVGYSMPETDAFFRHLFALSTMNVSWLKRFWVFDIETEGIVDKRYRKFLGPIPTRAYKYFPNDFTIVGGVIGKIIRPTS